jgi:hypothetical protein
MTIGLFLLIGLAVLLVAVLAWAVLPQKRIPLSAEQALEALSRDRHYARLPQILQCLREEDTEFIADRKHGALLAQLRKERRQIALGYLAYLEEEFRMLVECWRVMATLDPKLSAKGEFERFRDNLHFLFACRSLRWRLRLGMQPWETFGTLSDMAGTMTLQLEAAAMRLAEQAFGGPDSALLANRGGNGQ